MKPLCRINKIFMFEIYTSLQSIFFITTIIFFSACSILYAFKDKKEEIWLSPMTKAPTSTEMSKGQSEYTNNATKKFD